MTAAPETEPKCEHVWRAEYIGTVPVCDLCGVTPNASPSQVETRKLCKRKHAYSRRRARTESAAAKYGGVSHDICEQWGKQSTMPPDSCEGRTVMSMIGHLPPPLTAHHEYRPDPEPIMAGVRWIMLMDWISGYLPGVSVEFGDLKTTGSLAYAKDAEELATVDPQGLSYGNYLAHAYDVPTVKGKWVYALRCTGKKEPKPGRVVAWQASASALKSAFDREVAPHAFSMCVDRVHAPEQLERDVTGCGAFGGCPYRGECHGKNPLTHPEIATMMLASLRASAPRPKQSKSKSKSMTAATPDLVADLGGTPAPAPDAPAAEPVDAPRGKTPAPAGQPMAIQAYFENATRAEAVEMCGHLAVPCPPEGATPKRESPPIVTEATELPAPLVSPTVAPVLTQPISDPVPAVTVPMIVTEAVIAPETTSAPAPTVETKDEDFPATKDKAAKAPKGRPTLTEATKLLNSCALGGVPANEAETYLVLLEKIKHRGSK